MEQEFRIVMYGEKVEDDAMRLKLHTAHSLLAIKNIEVKVTLDTEKKDVKKLQQGVND